MGNTDENSIVSRISPVVPVYDLNFMYKVWDSEAAFTVQPIQVAPGEAPRQTVLTGRNETGTLQGFGLTLPIPDVILGEDRAKAQAITLAEYRLLESQFVTAYEYERAQLIASQAPVASGYGNWADANTDPIAQLDQSIQTINAQTGKMPTTLVMGFNAWKLLRDNPIARKLVTYNSVGVVTEDRLKEALIRRIPEVHIATMPYRDNTGTAKVIMDNEVYVLYKEDSPTQFDASAIKTFALGGKITREVVTEYKPTPALTLITNRVYTLTKVTNPSALIRFDATATSAS